MKRIPEPELMDDPEQARAYARADFSEPHQAFVEHFRRRFPERRPQRVLDLGCGAADISIRFARCYAHCQIVGVDGAEAMLALGREAVQEAGLANRIELLRLHLPARIPGDLPFDTILSNSLLHHLADPQTLWQTIVAAGERGAAVAIMDLARPSSLQAADALVAEYAGSEPPVLRRDFYHSLLAAYRPQEVRAQLAIAGLEGALTIENVSDRHVLMWGCLP